MEITKNQTKKILLIIEILNTINFDKKYNNFINQLFFKFIIAVILTL